jgi:Major Facilitator Superfamily
MEFVRWSFDRLSSVASAGRRLAASIRGPKYLRYLSVAHVLGIIAGGWVTVTLANSLFFDLSPDASRIQVLRYLAITMLPVAVLARVLGPALDRVQRGPRWFGVCSNLVRAGCCVGLAATVHTLTFFVWAFGLLIANKAYTASKYALLPSLVPRRELLVATNVLLAKWGAVAGAAGVGIGAFLNHVIGTRPLLLLAAVVFVLAAGAMNRLHRVPPAHAVPGINTPAVAGGARPSRRASLASVPFIATRCGVGFFSFTCAFTLRRAGASAAVLGGLVGCYAIGSLLGNILAPASRRRTTEERMITLTICAATVACAAAALSPLNVPIFVASFTLGFAAAHARQGFDSIVQSTSASAIRGRVFAFFETRSQLAWVFGALAATFFAIELRPASVMLAVVFAASLLSAREMFTRRAAPAYCGPPVLRPIAYMRPSLARLRQSGGND